MSNDLESSPEFRSSFERTDMSEWIALMGIRAAMAMVSKTARDAGWYTNPQTGEAIERNFGEVVALMHSELSEALESDRKNLMDDKLPHRPMREVELADAVIRICDLAGAYKIDLGGAIAEKLAFNAQRPDHKLENRQAEGGKAY